jgi:ComF family protein
MLCRGLFTPLENPEIDSGGKLFNSAHAAYEYEGLLRELLLQMKFGPKRAVAHALGELWAGSGAAAPLAGTVLVPLPMHPKKQRQRGFNQAEILAYYIVQAYGNPLEGALVRTVDTPPQAGLHARLRTENVKDVFAISPGFHAGGKAFTIIDDIYTTGASANEAARVLMAGGAESVHICAFSATMKD